MSDVNTHSGNYVVSSHSYSTREKLEDSRRGTGRWTDDNAHAAQHTRPAQCSRQGNGNALHALETQLRVANAFMNQFRLVARAPGPNKVLRINRPEQPSAL
ncbi:hypothetical protein L226DRAFT_540625, partial [Lentinus tigrinus ALCF2SS1-7]|uniref:uncharacterized protein n=1 Tax=Lentinus tigrinus ALCF2SS1-7 TaxID=1328758 RepID=UPI00116627A6